MNTPNLQDPGENGWSTSWFVRHRLYHIPFWFLYHTAWTILNFRSVPEIMHMLSSAYVIKWLCYIIFQIIGVYFNLYYLIPRFLEKQKIGLYLLFLAIDVMLTTAFIVAGYYLTAWVSDQSFRELWGTEMSDFFSFFNKSALPSTMASMTLAMSFKFAKNWISTRHREQQLEKVQLETELKFLRSQFNPHFLFNTINSIFVLINKNPKMASDALAKFSDLLRYQLYECNEHQIKLDHEIAYLENFIELETLRQDEKVQLSYASDADDAGQLIIAPFVLMGFVENAFKHVSRQNGRSNWIHIRLVVKDDALTFEISNSVQPKGLRSGSLDNYSGIGLRNIKRRLILLYPSKHELNIAETTERYDVHLTLQLTSVHTSTFDMASVSR